MRTSVIQAESQMLGAAQSCVTLRKIEQSVLFGAATLIGIC